MLMIQTRNTRRLVMLGALTSMLSILVFRSYLPDPAAWALLALGAALTVMWTLAYWIGIGEVARDAQKTAWLWGSLLGLIGAVMLATIPAVFPFIDAIIDWVDTGPGVVNASVVTGMLWVLAAQLIGFTIYWAGWWIAKR